jgi:hypothetical protein
MLHYYGILCYVRNCSGKSRQHTRTDGNVSRETETLKNNQKELSEKSKTL